MKKIFFVFLLFASIFSASAMSDFANKNFCFGISFPFIKNDYLLDDVDAVKLNAIAANLSYRSMKDSMKIGLFLDADIFFPYTKTIILNETYQTTTKFSDYDYFFGTDVLAGVYTVLYRDGSINLPIGAGLHLNGSISKQEYASTIVKETVYTVGLGAWFNFEINMTKRFGVYAGSKFAYDFYYKMNSKQTVKTVLDGKCKGFTFIPAVGLIWHP